MGPETETVHVNFGKPIPVFPLSQVVLLPHAVTKLFIFEARYRQMVDEVLDAHGLIAMGTFENADAPDSAADPSLRPAVCVGKIADHEKNPDGTYHIALAGVCRARIVREEEKDSERLYRAAMLEPMQVSDPPTEDELSSVRTMLDALIDSEHFPDLSAVKEQIEDLDQFPTLPLLDIASVAVSAAVPDSEFAYELLAEPSVFERAAILEREFKSLERIHDIARRQFDKDAPRGITWN